MATKVSRLVTSQLISLCFQGLSLHTINIISARRVMGTNLSCNRGRNTKQKMGKTLILPSHWSHDLWCTYSIQVNWKCFCICFKSYHHCNCFGALYIAHCYRTASVLHHFNPMNISTLKVHVNGGTISSLVYIDI